MSEDEPVRQGTQEPSYRRDGSGSLCWHLSCLCAVGRGARGLRSGCILHLFPLDSAGRTWICKKKWTLCLQLKCLQPKSGCSGSNAEPRSGWGNSRAVGQRAHPRGPPNKMQRRFHTHPARQPGGASPRASLFSVSQVL